MKNHKRKILAAVSGGVDSLAALLLLLEKGYDVRAVTFVTWNETIKGCHIVQGKKTPLQATEEAAALCSKLQVEHTIVDLSAEFEKTVISYFETEYLKGRTPNPCVFCNSGFKFFHLKRLAKEMNCEKIVTGHYTGLSVTTEGRYFLVRAKDDWKDQSFMLWNLPQEILEICEFPLQHFFKHEIKKYVAQKGFVNCAEQQESFSICFIPDNNYKRFLCERNQAVTQALAKGILVNKLGGKVGTHEGFPFYTIGQSKGFDYHSTQKLYIENVNPEKNEIQLATKNNLFKSEIKVSSLNFMKHEKMEGEHRFFTRIRGKDTGMYADVLFEESHAFVKFAEKVFAPAIGQSAVFYENNELVAGGTIEEIIS